VVGMSVNRVGLNDLTAWAVRAAWQGRLRRYIMKVSDFQRSACLISVLGTPAACRATQALTRKEWAEKRANSEASVML